jgi:hypothetical protein
MRVGIAGHKQSPWVHITDEMFYEIQRYLPVSILWRDVGDYLESGSESARLARIKDKERNQS